MRGGKPAAPCRPQCQTIDSKPPAAPRKTRSAPARIMHCGEASASCDGICRFFGTALACKRVASAPALGFRRGGGGLRIEGTARPANPWTPFADITQRIADLRPPAVASTPWGVRLRRIRRDPCDGRLTGTSNLALFGARRAWATAHAHRRRGATVGRRINLAEKGGLEQDEAQIRGNLPDAGSRTYA